MALACFCTMVQFVDKRVPFMTGCTPTCNEGPSIKDTAVWPAKRSAEVPVIAFILLDTGQATSNRPKSVPARAAISLMLYRASVPKLSTFRSF
eukprot:2129339-Pleurochrysis_carterae.AAC.1